MRCRSGSGMLARAPSPSRSKRARLNRMGTAELASRLSVSAGALAFRPALQEVLPPSGLDEIDDLGHQLAVLVTLPDLFEGRLVRGQAGTLRLPGDCKEFLRQVRVDARPAGRLERRRDAFQQFHHRTRGAPLRPEPRAYEDHITLQKCNGRCRPLRIFRRAGADSLRPAATK